MKKIISLALLLSCTLPYSVFAAPAAASTLPSQKKVITKTSGNTAALTAPARLPPTDASAVWEEVSYNNKLKVYFDSKSLKYDKSNGIITVWTKYAYLVPRSDKAKEVWLLSKYDVRMKTCADLYFINYDKNQVQLKAGPSQDLAWFSLTDGTLGSDICQALTDYLVNS